MPKTYDLIVLGTGTAASVAASRCREVGWSVAVIDSEPFGGTCALRGCDPKKVLVAAAAAVDHVSRMRGKGITGGSAIGWPALMAFKRTFTAPVPEERAKGFTAEGIDAYTGRSRFVGPRSVEVGGETLEGRFILIATGAAPMKLGMPGEELLATSTDFLDLDTLPERLVLVGGGYIAAEFSNLARRAGAEVTIVEMAPRLLTPFDPDLVALLTKKMRALGIGIRLSTAVESIEKTAGGFLVHTRSGTSRDRIEADLVVHAAGRVPALDDLNLEAAGVERSGRFVKINDFLQSVSNPSVYAVGDAGGSGLPLTPVAGRTGSIAAENILHGNTVKPNHAGVPSVAFSIPPIARVGMLESEAREQGLQARVRHDDTAEWYSARHVAEDTAAYKTIVEESSGRILGAHLLGPDAAELINIFGLAIRRGLTASELTDVVFAYPTAASDVSYMV